MMLSLMDFFTRNTPLDPNASLFGVNHLLWLILPLVAIFFLTRLARKNERFATKAILTMAWIMLTLRIVKYLFFYPFVWGYGWERLIPYELCTISSYLMPFVVFFRWKRIAKYLFPLAILGGFITMAYSEWIFNGYALDFNKLESLIIHILLMAIPFVSTGTDLFSFRVKEIWKPIALIIVLLGWAELANRVIEPGSNHMYTRVNPLPFRIEPFHHLFTFGLIFLILLALLYLGDYVRTRKHEA
jgi:hypothetical protein